MPLCPYCGELLAYDDELFDSYTCKKCKKLFIFDGQRYVEIT